MADRCRCRLRRPLLVAMIVVLVAMIVAMIVVTAAVVREPFAHWTTKMRTLQSVERKLSPPPVVVVDRDLQALAVRKVRCTTTPA